MRARGLTYTDDVDHALLLAQSRANRTGQAHGIFNAGPCRLLVTSGTPDRLRHALEVCRPATEGVAA